MYKVLLVDDEYFSREALKATIAWESYGCTICGEAKNGEDGIEKALALEPDIVLTDINMPFLDGLDMIMRLQQEKPDILYGIITGYSEFEYARRGIELGVEDFIIKPVDDREMIKTVQHMVKILDEKKQRQQEYERLKFWAEKNSEDNRKKFLHMVLMNGNELSEQHFAYECEQLDVPLQMGGYIVCCLKIDSRTYVQLSQKEWQDKIAGIIGEIGKNRRYTVYYKGQGCLYIIFSNMTEAKEDKMAASSLAQNIQIMLMQEWVCTVMAGVGFYCNTYQEIMKSRKEAEESVQDVRVSKLIREMLSYINAQYAEPDLSLKEIADKLFVNYSYLSAQFKKEMRMSASQYIVRLRMTKAADALRNGQSNMIEIACAVGYTDIKYFYRCFKKEFGITPYQYIGILQKVRESNEEV